MSCIDCGFPETEDPVCLLVGEDKMDDWLVLRKCTCGTVWYCDICSWQDVIESRTHSDDGNCLCDAYEDRWEEDKVEGAVVVRAHLRQCY